MGKFFNRLNRMRRLPARLLKHRFFRVLSALFLVLCMLVVLDLCLGVRGKVRLAAPPPTPLFEDRYGEFLAESEDGLLGFWQIPTPLPERLVACLLAIEDRRFFEHNGIDGRALFRALWKNLSGEPRQGASTLAMQVARLQDPSERTYRNKLREMATARLLIGRFGHDRVLAHYLAIAPQGNRMHGMAYAARRYFRKPVQDLSWAEASLLSALPKAPGEMNLYTPRGLQRAKKRAGLILDLLLRRTTLNAETHAAARRQLADMAIPVKEVRPFHSYHAILRMNESWHGEVSQPVRTTLDLGLQDRVDMLAYETIRRYRPLGAGNIAVIVADVHDGAILSYIGSDFYADDTHAGAIDYARVPRSSGSTLKPFLYALGLESGAFSANSVIADLPLHITHPSGHYSVSNYDEGYLGPLLYRQALANSRNVPAVQVLKRVGLTPSLDFFQRLGLTDQSQPANYYGLGMAIGGVYVTLHDLVAAYGVLANDGHAFQLQWFQDFKHQTLRERLLSEETARHISLFLSDPQARLPSFPRTGSLEYPFPVAVKTGTSQGYRDGWCVAFSREYLVGVWLGHPDHLKMKKVGGADAAVLVKEIMMLLHPEASRGVWVQPFPPPRGYTAVKLCPLSGGLAVPECTGVVLEYLPEKAALPEPAMVHRKIAVDGLTGRRAGLGTPGERIQFREYLVLPPEFADWGAKRGLGPPPPANGPQDTQVTVQAPADGSRLMLDPDTPHEFQSLALQASVTPAVPELVWYVDGAPFARAEYPYTARWALQPGTHRFQARFPNAAVASAPVTVTVEEP